MAVTIKYTNSSGGSVTIGGSAPYLYQGHFGFNGPKNNVYTVKSPNQDGVSVIGSDLDVRQLTIDGSIIANTQDLQPYRRFLTQVFNPKLTGTVEYINGDFDTKIDCEVDTPPSWSDDDYDGIQDFSVILLCPSPFFEALEQQRTEVAVWTGGIEFPLIIPETTIGFGNPITLNNVPDNTEFSKLEVTGESSQTTTEQGKNLTDKDNVEIDKYVYPTNGTTGATAYNNNATLLIRVEPSTDYTISGHVYEQPPVSVGLAWYDSACDYISGVSYGGATGNGTYTSPASAAYIRYTVNDVDLDTTQLEAGSSATAYETFVPDSPSADYSAAISGATTVTVSDGGSNSDDYVMPETLYSLPDGKSAIYNFINGFGTKDTQYYTFTGSETVLAFSKQTSYCSITFELAHKGIANSTNILSNRFVSTAGNEMNRLLLDANGDAYFAALSNSYTGVTSSDTDEQARTKALSWFTSHSTSILYDLAAQRTISSTEQTISAYVNQTIISADLGDMEVALNDGGVEFETRSQSLIVNVPNSGDVECGMRVVFSALAELTNPSIINVDTQETIKITADMQADDQIIITSGYGNNKVELVRAGVTTSAMNLLDILNTTLPFMKLQPGDNLIRYAAETNQDNLKCVIYNTPQYLGG